MHLLMHSVGQSGGPEDILSFQALQGHVEVTVTAETRDRHNPSVSGDRT